MLELFSGSGRMAQSFRDKGWRAETIDSIRPASLQTDINKLTKEDIIALLGGEPDFIWMSPPCTAFSVASIGTHWGGGYRAYVPKTEGAILGLACLSSCDRIIKMFSKTLWVIENPRGIMRKMPNMVDKKRYTITFCQYGENRMKPTDLWTNLQSWEPKKPCKNGANCHVPAPRGSKTGTQGLHSAYLRGILPQGFCEELSDYINNGGN